MGGGGGGKGGLPFTPDQLVVMTEARVTKFHQLFCEKKINIRLKMTSSTFSGFPIFEKKNHISRTL